MSFSDRFRSHRRPRPTERPLDRARVVRGRLDEVAADLARDADRLEGASVDVTASVLARLGYAQVDQRTARRARIALWTKRAASLSMVVVLLALAVSTVHDYRMRTAEGGAVEDVVRASLAEKRSWLGDVAEGLAPVARLPSTLPSPARPAAHPAERPVVVPSLVDPPAELNAPRGEEAKPAVAPFRKS
jgi:hypothetical protein